MAKSNPVCSDILTINPLDPEGFVFFVNRLSELLQRLDHLIPPLVILCIGSDRSTGDALGPLVGSMLTGIRMQNVVIYGTLESPVHALNLEQTFTAIRVKHNENLILAIDSSLGAKNNVGCLQLGMGSIRPGAAVNKKLPPVGDFFITGIVNVGGFMEFMVLQSTRLGLVLPLARLISKGIKQALYRSGFSQDTSLPREEQNSYSDTQTLSRADTRRF